MKKLLVVGTFTLSVLAFGKDYSKYATQTLISPEAAKEFIMNDKNAVVIDVRPEAKFLIGNVENSYNMWRPDMEPKDKRYGEVTGMRASREELEKELNQMGVTPDTTLVLIGEGLDEFRLWWILDMYGYDKVKVVDGGYSALKSAGAKTRLGTEPSPKQGNYKFPNNPDKDTLATLENVKSGINNPNVVIIDTRTDGEYLGKEQKKGAFAKGRIPSCVHVEWTNTLDADKKLKSFDDLKALYGEISNKEIIAYCQSGVRSAHTTFVLKELLGYPVVKNYDGSWIEWSYEASNNRVPVEAGDAK